MRTYEEIEARCKAPTDALFGFDVDAIVDYLPFVHVRDLLKPGVKEEDWLVVPLTEENVLKKLSAYMAFAWGKVAGHRGISADRSVVRLSALVWLLGDDKLMRAIERAPYTNYGAPKLKVICNRFKLPLPDDLAVRRMMVGKRCGAEYVCGCG